MSKRALITGIGGQDGSYLADILLEKGYEVHGLHRHSSVDNLARIAHVRDRVNLHVGDVTDHESVCQVVDSAEPDEVYHMADQDSVGDSMMAPGYQIDVTLKGTMNVLEAVRWEGKEAKVFVPISATVFSTADPPQNEQSPLNPQSHYACAKAAAWHLCKMYRTAHDMFVSCGIMFNHDSPRRGRHYLLQRIARGEELWGDMSTLVDVGHAREYMEVAWRMLQTEPDDLCVGTGRGHTIESLVNGEPVPDRHAGAKALIADCRKAGRLLGWNPEHDAFSTLHAIKESLR